MNLKHFYYRGYFDGRIKLLQPPKNSDARKKNEEANEKAFRLKNSTLTSTERLTAFSPQQYFKIPGMQELPLEVQNPGLLPGIGYPHEVGYPGEYKLGFSFDHVTGLPVLPGSSVKGVLRSVFPHFKFEIEHPQNFEPGDSLQLEKAKYIVQLLRRVPLEFPPELDLNNDQTLMQLAHALELSIFCGWDFSRPEAPERSPMCVHDIFLDAQPTAFKNQLLGPDALTPHTKGSLKNPIPIPFLKVMPGVTFGFCFKLQDTQIGAITITADQKRRIFGEILCTVGAGAKTNVGYGQFDVLKVEDRLQEDRMLAQGQGTTPGQAIPQREADSPLVSAKANKLVKFPFNKALLGKKIVGEVVSESAKNPVQFKILNVEDWTSILELVVGEALLQKFQPGLKFQLTVVECRPDQKKLKVKIENFQPVD